MQNDEEQPLIQQCAYLFGVYRHLMHGIDHYHVTPSIGVDEIGSIPLSQTVQCTGLIQEPQRGQILCSVKLGRIGLQGIVSVSDQFILA